MSDPRRPWRSNPSRQESDSTEPLRNSSSRNTDPAYSSQPSYPPYPPPSPTQSNPTERLPQYWQQGSPPPDSPPHDEKAPPERSKSPRWLWIAAGAAVLVVVALVIALVVANISAKKPTAVPPLPAMPGSSSKNPSASSSPSTTASASGPSSTETGGAGPTDTVAYSVTGDGRAISITYLDSNGVHQTEFNVVLPWSKDVALSKSAENKANVTIVNIGHEVTCSITVAGVQVRQHTGVGLTVCNAAG